MFDLLNQRGTITNAIPAAAIAATVTSSAIDLSNYAGSILVIKDVGLATAGTTPTCDIKIQDSADNSSYADVTGGGFTQVTDAVGNGQETKVFKLDKLRRYIKVVCTIAGASASFPGTVKVQGFKNYN